MKTRLLGPLVGLAVSFALPSFAQLKEVTDPAVRAKIEAATKAYDVAFNKSDAAGIVATFAPDVIETGPYGPAYGREAVQQRYADVAQKYHPADHLTRPRKDQNGTSRN